MRAKKSRKRPAIFPNYIYAVTTVRLLRHMYKGGIDTFTRRPDDPNGRVLLKNAIRRMNAVGRGDIDARVAFGQAPGRGGNRKSNTAPLTIAAAYWKARDNKMTVANACVAVRKQLGIQLRDATIQRIARENRATVLKQQEYEHDFDNFHA